MARRISMAAVRPCRIGLHRTTDEPSLGTNLRPFWRNLPIESARADLRPPSVNFPGEKFSQPDRPEGFAPRFEPAPIGYTTSRSAFTSASKTTRPAPDPAVNSPRTTASCNCRSTVCRSGRAPSCG